VIAVIPQRVRDLFEQQNQTDRCEHALDHDVGHEVHHAAHAQHAHCDLHETRDRSGHCKCGKPEPRDTIDDQHRQPGGRTSHAQS
jgi:hypothetical protein